MPAASVSNSPNKWVVLPHFAFAACAFLVVSVLLLFSTDAFAGHYFHPKLLTLTHVAVLGWATMLIFGALYQLLPVVLECKLYSERLAAAAFSLLAVGTVLLAICFWNFNLGGWLHVAGCCLFLAFVLFNINVYQTARLAPKWTITSDFIVTSALWLLLTGFLGLLMAINFTNPFLPKDHLLYLKMHAHMGMAGWFLLLIIGVGSKLIPMFLLSHPKGTRKLSWSYNLINAGLLLFVVDQLFFQTTYLPIYAALVVAGVALFMWYIYEARALALRKDLDLGMQQTFIALLLLLLPLVIVFLVSAEVGLQAPLLSALYLVYGLSVFLGFVTALILGQTFKTLPFIVWMHVYEKQVGRFKTPLPKDLYFPKLLQAQNFCYLAGYITLLLGVLLREPSVIMAGSIVFTAAALLYTVNVFHMLLHRARQLEPITYGKSNS